MAPMVHRLEIDYWGQIDFTFMDIDDEDVQPYRTELSFQYQPQLILLDGEGNIVDSIVGPRPEEELRAALDSLLDS